METKNYAKSSEKWGFSTINATIFSLKKRLNCSLNTLESLTTGWYSTFWFFTDASCQTCQSCQTHFGNLSNPLINYIFKIYNYIRALTDFSFSVWQVWQLWQLWQYCRVVVENPDFGQVRTTTGENGAPFFCAVDVCRALGYGNSRDALRKHVMEDDVTKRDTIDSILWSRHTTELWSVAPPRWQARVSSILWMVS